MTTPHKATLIQARDWIAGKGEIVFAGCGMAAVDKMNALHAALQAAIDAPEPEPVAYLVYANGSHRYSTLTFDVSKVPEIYVGGDVVALYTAAGAAPVPQGWQPIETAPKDGSEIIVMYMHIDTQIVHNAFWLVGDEEESDPDGWWSYDHSEVSRIRLDDWMTPTHWMPLPAAPKEAK